MEYTVRSSHGELTIDKDGYVLERQIDYTDSDAGTHLVLIARFDLVEWQHHWNNPEGNSIDILDLGYWYNDPKTNTSTYEPPDADWRKEIAEILFQRQSAAHIRTAAPKLLKALEIASLILDVDKHNHAWDGRRQEAVDIINAAIAEATGGLT